MSSFAARAQAKSPTAATPTAPLPARQLVNIQYLRALSAFAIVLFHAGDQYHVHIPIGEGRVALFFIVSGFVFWWITTGKTARSGPFLQRRLARLVPLYWMVTLLTAAAIWRGSPLHPGISVQHLLLSLLFIPHGKPIFSFYMPVFFPGWTLVYEMFFCVLFALLLYLKESWRLWATTALLAGLPLVGFICQPTQPITSVYTNPILIEFLLGVWIAWLWPRVQLGTRSACVLLAMGLLLSFAMRPLHNLAPELVVAAIPALLIVVGTLGMERSGARVIGWLKRVGDSSYSIYIWHLAAFKVVTNLAHLLGVQSAPLLIALSTAAAMGAGLVLYALIERPLTEALMRAISHRGKARRAAVATPLLTSS